MKRSLVISTSSFSTDDYAEMLHLRRVFIVAENFGVLRQVSRFVRQETRDRRDRPLRPASRSTPGATGPLAAARVHVPGRALPRHALR